MQETSNGDTRNAVRQLRIASQTRQFSLRALLTTTTATAIVFGVLAQFGQTAAAVVALTACIAGIQLTRLGRRTTREALSESCLAAAAGLAVGGFRIGGTLFGYFLIVKASDLPDCGLNRPVVCALVTGAGYALAREALALLNCIKPRRNRFAVAALVCVFVLPNTIFVASVAKIFTTENNFPFRYIVPVALMNTGSVVVNVVLLHTGSRCLLSDDGENALSYARLLLLFDLWMLALWGWPFVEGI